MAGYCNYGNYSKPAGLSLNSREQSFSGAWCYEGREVLNPLLKYDLPQENTIFFTCPPSEPRRSGKLLIFNISLLFASENRNNHEKQLPEHHWLIHSVRGAGADRLQHRVLQHHGKARVREARYPGRPGRECPGCPDRCPGNLPLVTGTVPECGGHSRYRTEGQVRRNPRCLSRQQIGRAHV